DGVRSSWGIGIQDPFGDVNDPAAPSADVVFVTNESVVTSGDYQRYYVADGKRVHHIIDPDTLHPANYYRGLTIVNADSGLADLFSTALFCMDYPTSRAFADSHGLKVLWIMPDGTVSYTDNLLPQLRDRGGATAKLQK
ncbi:MAG: FAD:protein FMN transferase, partial [Angelakisella sp.]